MFFIFVLESHFYLLNCFEMKFLNLSKLSDSMERRASSKNLKYDSILWLKLREEIEFKFFFR